MNIENSLKKLGLSGHNIGTSTGSNYFSNGDSISSYSPVDGKEIGTVSTTTYEDWRLDVDDWLEVGDEAGTVSYTHLTLPTNREV